MFSNNEKKIVSDHKSTTTNNDQTNAFELLRCSVNELQRQQIDIHRHIGQLSTVMSDFEYYMEHIRHIGASTNDTNNGLCQSLLSHIQSIIDDTRSALVTSSSTKNDTKEIHDLVQRLYEENQRIANHIDDLIQEDQFDTKIESERRDEDHIEKAIKHIELALAENIREQEYINREQEHFENNQNTIETFIQTAEQLHEEALKKLREHMAELREHNQSLKQYNEQIDLLTKQLPLPSLLSSK